MKLVEFFSGSGIMSKTFRDARHNTITYDNNHDLNPDICIDFEEINIASLPKADVVWASPPCTTYSIAAISHHRNMDRSGKTEFAKKSDRMIKLLLQAIQVINPKYFFIENPRGMLRKMDFMQELHRKTITYCQYGDSRMKPTDIWTNAIDWKTRPMCKNGDPCHESAPRGSKTGTQGLKGNYNRSILPKELCIEILEFCEANI